MVVETYFRFLEKSLFGSVFGEGGRFFRDYGGGFYFRFLCLGIF